MVHVCDCATCYQNKSCVTLDTEPNSVGFTTRYLNGKEAGRKLLIELAPRERLAQYFSLYGLTTKVSIIGSAVFGTIVDQVTRATGSDLTAWKAALYFQAVPLTLGLFFLMLVRKPKPVTDELSTT